MEPRSIFPRVGKTLVSLGLGLTLVCGILLLFGSVTQLANAAPLPPRYMPAPPLQATIGVTNSIQSAINTALPGDTVVFTGTYTEEVVINKSLTLQGAFPTSTIVYNAIPPSDPTSPTIHVTTNAVTITNMTLVALGGIGLVEHSAISVENSSNVKITGVKIQNYPTGIEVGRTIAGPTGITITNNIIQEPNGGVMGEGGVYFYGSGAGIGSIQATIQSNQVFSYSIPPHIHLSGLAPTLIASNILTTPGPSPNGLISLDQIGSSVVQNNQIIATDSVSTLMGIRVTGSANPTITQNTIDSQIRYGIRVDSSAAPVITNSTLSGHSLYGINIIENSQPQIFNTILTNNTLAGIRISGNAQPQVFGNVISGSSFAAIWASPTVTPTIARNRFLDNLIGIFYDSPSPATTFAFGNTICRNTPSLSNTSGITLSFTGNWWGHNPPLTTADIDGDPVNTSPISMALGLNPSPALIPLNGTVDITLTMRGGGYNVLDGTGINFSATGGSFSVVNTTTLNGLANTVYTGTVLGTHIVTVTDECGGIVTDTVIVGEPVLTTTKTAVPPPGTTVRPGEAITYTIYVTNTGGYTATGVVFSDTIPTFTQLAAATIDSGTIDLTNPVSATFSPIPPNNGVMSVTLRVTVTLPLTNGTWLTNTASISYFNGTTSVITPTNPVTHEVVSSPVLTITKSADPPSPGPVRPGDVITYTMVVRNLGDANATNVLISDTIPANTQYIFGTDSLTYSGGASGPMTTLPGTEIRFHMDYLPAPNGVMTAAFAVSVTQPLPNGTIITNTAQVTSTEVATITYSNDVTHEVESSPEITITKQADPPHGTTVVPGQTITYTLTVTNVGDELAQNVVVTDELSVYVNYVSATPSVGTITPTGRLITWTIGSLTIDVPVSAQIVVTVTTPLTNNTTILNTGYVTHMGSSVITASNTVTHLVQSSPNVTYTKVADPPGGSSLNLSLSPPTQITYTIIVTNDGNADATSLTITDTVPANTSGSGLAPWSPGFLPGNGGVVSNTFVVTVNVPLPDLTVITNVYEVSYNEVPGIFDATSALSPTNIVTHLIRSNPVVSVTKNSVPTPTSVVTPGQIITYDFVITNSGTATATNFVLSDTVPANTTYITNSVSASAGASVSQSPSVVTVTQTALSTSEVVTFTFAVQVNSPLANGTIISNIGSYIFDQSASVSQTNVVTHLVQSAPDITLTKTAIPAHGSPVSPGERITYTITITNNGTADATSAVLTDVVPQYTQYVSGTAFPTPPASVNPMVWNLGTIAGAGGIATATFAVQVDSPLTGGLTISNSALLDIAETAGLSQTNVVTHLVQSSTDITFTKSADPPSGSAVAPGDTITYTLVAANNGSQIATGVVMTDSLPAEVNVVTYTWSKAPTPTVAGNLFTWDIDTLTANETVTATIRVTVTTPLTRGTVITNQGELLTNQTGLSTTNYVTHTVISTPTLTLSKSANPPSGSGVFPGDTITYTIAVTNSGNGPATNFLITDTVPISTNLTGNVSTTPGFTPLTGTNALTVSGTLAAGQAMTVTFAVTLSTTGLTEGAVLTNIGYVSYTESPVISPTNAVTHLIRLTPALTLTKMAEPAGPTIGAGEAITYTVIISNNDIFFDAFNVVITDFIPVDTNYVNGSFISTQGITTGPDPLQVTVATLTGTQVMSFTFQVTVTTPITNGAIISNVAQMSADYLSVVNSNEVTHTVVATADLVVQKSAAPPSGTEVDPGDAIIYFIQVTNNGAANATNLMITDTMPISTEYVLSQLLPPVGTMGGPDPLTVTVPSLAGNGGTMEYRLVVTVTNNAPPGLVISNFAQISSNETAITTTNVVTHQVSGTSVLTIAKTAVPAAGTGVQPGDPITYTVTITNSGTNTLSNLIVFDILDPNTNLDSISCSPAPCIDLWPAAAAMWPLLAPGNSASLQLTVTVTDPLTVGTVITNIATASSSETGVVATGPVTHVIVSPVVVITKTDNVTVVQPGDTLTYSVTISNEGNMMATGLIVTDTVPTNTNYVAGSATGGGSYNPATREITWTIGALAQGTAVTYTFVVTVDNPIAAGVSSITNTIVVTDDSGSSATAEDVDVVNAAPNLIIYKAPSGVTEPGQVITYTITYTNTGNQDASGVTITESVPLNTNFNLGVSTPGWSCADNAPAGTNCAFNVGAVNGGNGAGSVTFAVTVTTPLSDGTIISNTAYISHDGTTVITPSNTVTHLVQLRPSLTMTKVADPVSGSTVNPDDPITYTITLINNGTGDATGVVITDVLDPNVLLASVSPPGAVSSTNPLVLDVGTVAAGGGTVSYTVRVTVTSPLTNGLVISNQAQVTAVEVPTVTLSNQVTHTVVSTPNLLIQKNSPTTTTVPPGGSINYVISILNNGNGPATNVMITDTIPVSTTLFSASLVPPTSGTVVTSSTRITVTIPVLNGGGGGVTLLMSVNVDSNAPPGLVITNAAQIDSDQTVLTSSNTVTHVVGGVAMLNIFKAADPPDGATVSPGQMITYTLTVMNSGTTAADSMTLTDFLPIIGVTTPSNINTTPGFTVLSISPTLVVSGTLGPGSTMTATFQVTVSNVVSGTVLTNTAQVTATSAASDTASIAHRVVVPVYDLAITKSANPPSGSTVEPGDLITYTVTVVNNGDPVTNVIISDTLDPNVTLVASNTTTGTLSGPNPVQVTGFDLASGESVTVTLGVTVANALSGTIIYNQASVTSTQSVSLAVSSVVTHVISNTTPLPSLAITKTATPASGSSVGPNSTITYTITVANVGTGDATNVVMTDTLPITWVNLITATLSNTGTVAGTNPLTAGVGTLNAGSSVTLTIVVTTSTVATDTLITNTAYVAADTLSVQASQPVTHIITTTPTVPTPTLAITKTATPASGSIVEPGDYITYTITAQNSGPGAATNVVISDTLDLANVTLVNSSTTTGTLGGPNPVQVTNFDLNPGQGVTVTLVVTVTGNVSGTVISNQVSVTSTEAAMLEVSGLVTHVISSSITVSPNFTITKSANPVGGTTVTQNDTIDYTIVVVNSGGPATNVIVTDTIPAGTAYANNATANFGTPGFDGTNFIVNVNTFTAGLTLTAAFRVTVTTNLTTTISNVANLDSDQTSLQNSNTVTHPVQGTGPVSGAVYLPIIFRDFTGAYATLQWDNVEPVRDRVRDLDGAAGICFSPPCDGQDDGVFKLTVSLGSEGPKAVSSIRLISTQGVEWDTIPGNGPALGVFNGPPLNSPVDGSVTGVLLGPPNIVHLLASDDTSTNPDPRFPRGTYVYTVIINFSDGTSLMAQTGVF